MPEPRVSRYQKIIKLPFDTLEDVEIIFVEGIQIVGTAN